MVGFIAVYKVTSTLHGMEFIAIDKFNGRLVELIANDKVNSTHGGI